MVRRTVDPKVKMLQELEGLGACRRDELLALARVTDEHGAAAGEVIAAEGRPGRRAWIVLDGYVDVVRRGTVLWTAGRGSLVGDVGVLGAVPGAVSLVAASDARLLALAPRADDTIFELPGLARWACAQLDRQVRIVLGAPLVYEAAPVLVTPHR